MTTEGRLPSAGRRAVDLAISIILIAVLAPILAGVGGFFAVTSLVQ
jgi:hypothetical protein